MKYFFLKHVHSSSTVFVEKKNYLRIPLTKQSVRFILTYRIRISPCIVYKKQQNIAFIRATHSIHSPTKQPPASNRNDLPTKSNPHQFYPNKKKKQPLPQHTIRITNHRSKCRNDEKKASRRQQHPKIAKQNQHKSTGSPSSASLPAHAAPSRSRLESEVESRRDRGRGGKQRARDSSMRSLTSRSSLHHAIQPPPLRHSRDNARLNTRSA